MANEDKSGNEIDITEFLQSNSALFVVLGVFSALSIYISDLGGGSIENAPDEIRIGFGGSLLLSTLLVVLIYRQLIDQAGSLDELLKAHTEVQNWDLIVFTSGIILLSPSFISPIVQEDVAFYFVLNILFLVLFIGIIVRIILQINKFLPEGQVARKSVVIALGFVVALLSDKYVMYVRSNPQLVGPGPFSPSNLMPVFYDSTGVIAAVAFISSVFVIGLSTLELAEEIGNLYRDHKER